jgi:dynactin complex subunit
MLIEVKRFEFKDTHTIGKMYVDGVYECYTLEDVVRNGTKVLGKTAIPTGEYKLIIDASVRFKQDMPHILNVPNFTGVRIHSGNTSADTDGCILLGTTWAGKTL